MTKYLKLISAIAALLLAASCGSTKNTRKSLSGNPVFPGWYADPEGAVFGKEYWIFPTLSDLYAAPGEEMPAYPPRKARQSTSCTTSRPTWTPSRRRTS